MYASAAGLDAVKLPDMELVAGVNPSVVGWDVGSVQATLPLVMLISSNAIRSLDPVAPADSQYIHLT